jgi:large conductance mechanosensitive channel
MSSGSSVKERAKAKAASAKNASKSHAGGFVDFVRQQGVVGLAVGLAIGTAAGAAVKSIVDEFINPIIGFIVGGVSLEGLVWKTGLKNLSGEELVFGWGAILSAVITLLATALVIYQIVHIAKLDRVDKKKG